MNQSLFYLIVQPGLEKAAEAELRWWWPKLVVDENGTKNTAETPAIYTNEGGLEFEADTALALQLNFVLKIPSRLLLRFAEFKCADFPNLFRRISKIPWRDFFDGDKVEWMVSSRLSRLTIKRRIEETCNEAYGKYCEAQPPGKNFFKYVPRVHVRLYNDVCTISLDTSGEHLHLRGYRTHVGEAPLRENIAAATISFLREQGKSEDVTLIDPLCGSGVLPLEASLLRTPLRLRHFDFEYWRNCPMWLRYEHRKIWLSQISQEAVFKNCLGLEKDEEVLRAASVNLEKAGSENVQFFSADIIEGSAIDEMKSGQQRWVICNPPWGERISIAGDRTVWYGLLFQRIATKIQPQLAAFLLPEAAVKKGISIPPNWRLKNSLPISVGGIKTLFLIYVSK